jgi:hypothetical protein
MLPVGFVCVLVGIKIGLESNENFKPQVIPEDFPIKEDPIIPLTMTDYMIGFRASRVCNVTSRKPYDRNQKWPYEISNYFDNQNPFMKCDRRACKFVGDDARKYCEYAQLALAPISKDQNRGKKRVAYFANWLMKEYSGLEMVPEYSNNSFIRFFDDSASIDQYIRDPNYGSGEKRKIAFAILFGDGENDFDFLYTLRANSTNFNVPENAGRPAQLTHPPTRKIFDDFAASDKACTPAPGTAAQGNFSESCTGQYMYNGAVTMQRLIGDFIHNITFSKARGFYIAEHGISFVNFPTKAYSVDGFYKTVNRESKPSQNLIMNECTTSTNSHCVESFSLCTSYYSFRSFIPSLLCN